MADVVPGQKFGAWTVLQQNPGSIKALCQCVCGNTKRIRKYDLVNGKSLMCRSCSVSLTKTSRGGSPHSKTRSEYNTWVHMVQRCHNPRSKDYKNYGGRGIEVCEMWRESFDAFLLSVGPKPTPDHTIERIDYNSGYEPGNCTWATRAEQNRNTRSNVTITINEVTQTVAEWAREPGCSVSQFTIYKRLKRGWDEEEAVFAPSGTKKGTFKRES